ncbi:hypothetical protein BO71DRAFT_486945 [Aspergillus ellipticus CBS 707.79]|uniref:Uncharacterized protein n=1 Tax=Aspergillus ellipticus CBS 707.79 TaxID=1448320 RepID=A0A319D830_9EURO|nr:hypothetical protein BO71DRAFT_486945 [Aspergillus ellipticus CBS 707.79]
MGERQTKDASSKGSRPGPTQRNTGENVNTLKAEITRLQEEHAAFKARVEERDATLDWRWWVLSTGAGGWGPDEGTKRAQESPPDMVKDFGYIFGETWRWCAEYAKQNTADVAGLSNSEKQSIIRSLEGYCVQDLDWDTLLGFFPASIRRVGLVVFAQALLAKDFMEKFFNNPFWYFEGSPDQQEQGGSPGALPLQLQHLYKQFIEGATAIPVVSFMSSTDRRYCTNETSAHHWRSETIRLANSTRLAQGPNVGPGRQTKKQREAAISSSASSMLTSDPFRLLLKQPEDAKKAEIRDQDFFGIYTRAEDVILRINAETWHVQYKTLAELPALFARTNMMVEPHFHHNLDWLDPRLDGRRILLITRPAGKCFRTVSFEVEFQLGRAEAVVEDGEQTLEDDKRAIQENHRREHARERAKMEEWATTGAQMAEVRERMEQELEEVERQIEKGRGKWGGKLKKQREKELAAELRTRLGGCLFVILWAACLFDALMGKLLKGIGISSVYTMIQN